MRYDGRLESIFALQDEITAKIVAAMQINLAPASADGSRRRSTASVESYEYYLQARSGFFLFTPETNACRSIAFSGPSTSTRSSPARPGVPLSKRLVDLAGL